MSPIRPQGVHSTDSCNEQDPASSFHLRTSFQPLVHDVPAPRAPRCPRVERADWAACRAGACRVDARPRGRRARARTVSRPRGPGRRKRAVYTVSVEASVLYFH